MGIFALKVATIAIFVAVNIVESKYLLVKMNQLDKYDKITGASLSLAGFRSKGPISGILVVNQFQMI